MVRENDLPAYYNAGQLIAAGKPDLLYGSSFRPQHNRFTNLPIVAPLFVPLAKLDYAAAWHLFWWLQVLSYVGTGAALLFAVRRHGPPLDAPRAALVLSIWAAFIPTLHRCLVLGQSTPMLVFVFALFVLTVQAGRLRGAGALLGVICLMKIPPMLLLPLLALRRRTGIAGIAFGIWLAAVGLSALVFGADTLQRFAQWVIFDNAGGSIASFNNQSLDGAWMRLLSTKSLVDWTPTPRPGVVLLADVGSFALLGSGLLRFTRAGLWPDRAPDEADPRRGTLVVELWIGVLLMLLVFPVVWIHYYLFALVPLALVPSWLAARGRVWRPWQWAAFAAGVFALGSVPVYGNVYYELREADPVFRMLQNLRPLGALGLLALALPLARDSIRVNRPAADGVC